jgi:hypothetical protein
MDHQRRVVELIQHFDEGILRRSSRARMFEKQQYSSEQRWRRSLDEQDEQQSPLQRQLIEEDSDCSLLTISIFADDQRRFTACSWSRESSRERSHEWRLPSSSETRLRFDVAAACWIFLPTYDRKSLRSKCSFIRPSLTSTEPVKAILSIRSCMAMAWPHSAPSPGRMFTTPGGKPALRNDRYETNFFQMIVHTSLIRAAQ